MIIKRTNKLCKICAVRTDNVQITATKPQNTNIKHKNMNLFVLKK